MAEKGSGGFTLEVPVDASAISAEDATEQELKVVVKTREGELSAKPVKLKADGTGTVTFSFPSNPGPLHVLIGPDRAEDEELAASQTITAEVRASLWEAQRHIQLEPLRVSPYYWWWWLRWCREFTIRGRVVCPDGSAVPGAEVCAYDVDWWWWWTSKQLVGCAFTDINGSFDITFRWCCGLWPWWWWRYRIWELEPDLIDRIGPVLERDPRIQLAHSSGVPSLDVFQPLLARETLSVSQDLATVPAGQLEQIRTSLLEKLPAAPELAAQRIWPWCPWWPWWDCTPDIIFRVTQDCHFPGAVILDEGVGATRWDIPNPLDVTLVANDLACCRSTCPDPPCPAGDCIDFSSVCSDTFLAIDSIGGNLGAPAGPDGYQVPADRPFAGTIPVLKGNEFIGVDYYGIEIYNPITTNWDELPPGAAVDFCRHWIRPWPSPGNGSVNFKWALRNDGVKNRLVVESREHWEATVGLPATAFWAINAELVIPIDTTKFSDGTYTYRAVGYLDNGPGKIKHRHVLPWCGTTDEAEVVLTFDNRTLNDLSVPSPCWPRDGGTVHLCTQEPKTDFVSIMIDGQPIDECGTSDATSGDLEIVFDASDVDGHLGGYALTAHWGSNHVNDLLALGTLHLLSGDAKGPSYAQAISGAVEQGAARPTWNGGRMRLTVPVSVAFPEPCCYELRLEAWKRIIVGGGGGSPCGFNCSIDQFQNLSEFTVGVGVCEPPHVIGRAPLEIETAAPVQGVSG